MDKNKMVEISFNIISKAGEAKALFVEAIHLAKKNEIELAREKIKEGSKILGQSHVQHFEVIQKEANNEKVELSTLFIHAEDQFMTTEILSTLAEELIDMYEIIHKK